MSSLTPDIPLTGDVTVAEVREVLGEDTYSVAELCTSDNINVWSKYRPVSSSTVPMTDTLRANLRYGWTFSAEGTTSPLTAAEGTWTANLPSGGSSSPYRLGDFRGYCSDAIAPVVNWSTSTVTSTVTSTSTLSVSAMTHDDWDATVDTCLSYNDLTKYDTVYYAILLVSQSNTSNAYIQTSSGGGQTDFHAQSVQLI